MRQDNGAFEQNVRRAQAGFASLPDQALTKIAKLALTRVAQARDGGTAAANAVVARALIDALLSDELNAAQDYVESLTRSGVTREVIYLDHLPEVARRLGVLWEEDRLSLLDVTTAMARLQSVVRHLAAPAFEEQPRAGLEAIFAVAPGETHTLGVRIATNLFREIGWDITLLLGLEHEELVEQIKSHPAHLLGLSAGGETVAPALTALVISLRMARPDLRIIICGQVVECAPALIDAVLPDGAAIEFEDAKTQLESFVHA
ncbi:MAG: cobalamin-dependent protein [Pseudomonadota bacterium]